MYWDGLDTDTKARLIRDGLRMGMRRWESVRDAYDAAEYRRLAAGQDGTDDDGYVIIDDPRGQWAHPGEVTRIPSNEITMKGVPYPVVGVSDTGDTKVMEPGGEYSFDGREVTEYPVRELQFGGHVPTSLDSLRLANAMANRPFANTTVEDARRRQYEEERSAVLNRELHNARNLADKSYVAVAVPESAVLPSGKVVRRTELEPDNVTGFVFQTRLGRVESPLVKPVRDEPYSRMDTPVFDFLYGMTPWELAYDLKDSFGELKDNGFGEGRGLDAALSLASFLPIGKIKPQIRPLAKGAEIERQLSKAGTISRKSLDAYKAKQRNYYQEIMNDVLESDFNGVDKIDYKAFKDAVQRRLPEYSRIPRERYKTYGMRGLGFDVKKEIDDAGKILESVPDIKTNTFTFETPGIAGNTKHYPGNPIGHSRTYTTSEEPDILHVMESQSDWAQKYSGLPFTKEQLRNQLQSPEFSNSERKAIQDDIDNYTKNYLQKKHIADTYTERQIQENLRYAAEHGQTKMRYPTRETAAKIEGYPITRQFSREEYTNFVNNYNTQIGKLKDKYNIPKNTPLTIEELDDNFDPGEIIAIGEDPNIVYKEMVEKIGNINKKDYNDFLKEANKLQTPEQWIVERPLGYRYEHETILRKYDAFPKQFKKIFGNNSDVRTVTDGKDNTWYEVDVPKSYIDNTGEIIFQYGGKLKSREAQAWEAETKRRIANNELPNAFQLNVIGNIDRRGANTDFIQRARDPYRQTIPDLEGRGDVATHKLGWATDGNGTFIFPEVQRTGSGLVDYSDTSVNGGDRWMAADRARQTGDYVRATPLEAKVFTENYKKFYPFGN